jgi:hypothetical protein
LAPAVGAAIAHPSHMVVVGHVLDLARGMRLHRSPGSSVRFHARPVGWRPLVAIGRAVPTGEAASRRIHPQEWSFVIPNGPASPTLTIPATSMASERDSLEFASDFEQAGAAGGPTRPIGAHSG